MNKTHICQTSYFGNKFVAKYIMTTKQSAWGNTLTGIGIQILNKPVFNRFNANIVIDETNHTLTEMSTNSKSSPMSTY